MQFLSKYHMRCLVREPGNQSENWVNIYQKTYFLDANTILADI